jgi:hypothetical protein
MIAKTNAIGRRIRVVDRVTSTQKLPIVSDLRLTVA